MSLVEIKAIIPSR